MMHFSGQNLQRNYQKCGGGVLSDKERLRAKKDKEALRKNRKNQPWKTQAREDRMDARDSRESLDKRIEKKIERLPLEEEREIKLIEDNAKLNVENRIEEAKNKTNKLAREYGLTAPNNAEAVEFDRYHCYACAGKLHIPDAYKGLDDSIAGLFDDTSVKHLCCFCFMDMEKGSLNISKGEATSEIRLAVYDPIASVDKNIDIKDKVDQVRKMSDLDRLRLKSKMKQYKHVINLVGNIKHDDLEDGDRMENHGLYGSKGIYACTF